MIIASLGHLAIDLALAVALSGALLSFVGGYGRNREYATWGRYFAVGVLGLVTAAVALMIYALVTHDFAVKYVSDVGSRQTPLYYTIISLWAALEGSILFWAFLLSIYTVVFLSLYRERFAQLLPWITGILLANSVFFLLVIAGPGNPFTLVNPPGPTPGCPAGGCGPNPLLQDHWIMGVHPPLLYLGYVGLSVPYAIAMASLITGASGPDVLRLIRRWALIPWVCLTVGIVMGMWWSYAVLGWGGYWSWDPVENASVMPWLVTTAFLHSLQVQERRQMLKTWTLSLIVAAFLLVILGTFLTRSGVLLSVHSFTQSAIGPVFLTFFAVVLVASVGLILARSGQLNAPGSLDAAVCRETAFLFNNLLLVGVTFTILLGTIFPLIGEALQGTQFSVGAPYFDSVDVPIGLALLFLMGVGPSLPWGAARFEDLQWRLLAPVVVGTGIVFLLLILGVRGTGPLVTFGLAGFVLTVTVTRVVTDIRIRRGNTRQSWLPATRSLVRANPRRYGGYIVHVGVLLMVIGIAASQSYQARATRTLHPGQSMAVDGYTVTFQGYRPHWGGNRMVLPAVVSATRGNEALGTLLPAQNIYPALQQPVVTPAIREEPGDMLLGLLQGRSPLPDLAQALNGRNPFEDLYIVLEAIGPNTHHPTATLQVMVNPMVGFIWLGGGIVGLGGLLALLPAARRRRVTVEIPERSGPALRPAPTGPEEATV